VHNNNNYNNDLEGSLRTINSVYVIKR